MVTTHHPPPTQHTFAQKYPFTHFGIFCNINGEIKANSLFFWANYKMINWLIKGDERSTLENLESVLWENIILLEIPLLTPHTSQRHKLEKWIALNNRLLNIFLYDINTLRWLYQLADDWQNHCHSFNPSENTQHSVCPFTKVSLVQY